VTLAGYKPGEADDIRKAYRKLARKHHPDLNPGDKSAEDRFKKVQEAYDVLSEPKKKQMYDQVGFYSENGAPGAGGRSAPGSGPNMGFGGFDFSDYFSQAGAGQHGGEGPEYGGGFRDLFSQFFHRAGGREQPHATPEKGTDLEYALNIDFWQAIRGTQVTLNISRQDTCPTCGGSGSAGGGSTTCPQCKGSGNVTQMAGAMRFTLTCPRCGGTGRLRNVCPTCQGEGRLGRTETVDVRIPAGVQTGTRLRVAGKGNAGTMGAPSGDLYITVRVEPHQFFQRDGDDILIRVPITVTEAGLGAKIEVPTLTDKDELEIPAGTQHGEVFKLKGKGLPDLRSKRTGDELVQILVEIPRKLTEKQKQLLREFAGTEDAAVMPQRKSFLEKLRGKFTGEA
jgi:molecular chaperone DnaJ